MESYCGQMLLQSGVMKVERGNRDALRTGTNEERTLGCQGMEDDGPRVLDHDGPTWTHHHGIPALHNFQTARDRAQDYTAVVALLDHHVSDIKT